MICGDAGIVPVHPPQLLWSVALTQIRPGPSKLKWLPSRKGTKAKSDIRCTTHFYKHTIICVPGYGGNPSEPTGFLVRSAAREWFSDFRLLVPGLHRPRLAATFPWNLLSPSQPLFFGITK